MNGMELGEDQPDNEGIGATEVQGEKWQGNIWEWATLTYIVMNDEEGKEAKIPHYVMEERCEGACLGCDRQGAVWCCGQCRDVAYCSTVCYMMNWKDHELECWENGPPEYWAKLIFWRVKRHYYWGVKKFNFFPRSPCSLFTPFFALFI